MTKKEFDKRYRKEHQTTVMCDVCGDSETSSIVALTRKGWEFDTKNGAEFCPRHAG
jgi:hypothetical protein